MGRSITERITFVQQRIAELGHKVHPTSRLAREADVFRDESGTFTRFVGPDDSRFRDAQEALRDYTLFEFILSDWPFQRDDRGAGERLKLALKDAVDPYSESERTPGRDTQLELYVAVSLHRGGLPVHLGTPDIRVRINSQYFFVEAKRPKTLGTVATAIKQAASQIQKRGCPGSVFVDASRAFNPHDLHFARITSDAAIEKGHQKLLDAHIGLIEEDVRSAIRGKSVASVFFQDHRFRQVHGGWILESLCTTYANPDRSERLATLASRLDSTLEHGWTLPVD